MKSFAKCEELQIPRLRPRDDNSARTATMGRGLVFHLWMAGVLLGLLVATPRSGFSQDEPPQEGAEQRPRGPRTLPLKATDKVEFTTDEGTWMSLDVSPDGKLLVFDLLGDVYTLPIAGGQARRIVGGIAFESQPRFSPDGKRIVFLSDRDGAENVWTSDLDGTSLKQVSKARNAGFLSPSYTHDGNWILVSRADEGLGGFHVWLYDVNGGTGVSLGAPPPKPEEPRPGEDRPQLPNKMGAVASPDGRFVYYAMRRGGFNYNATFPLWQIQRFDRDTSDVTTMTDAQGSAMRPLLSPDGKFLVYATRYELNTALRVRDLETGDERWLINPVARDDQESRATRDTLPGYAFMPDGKSLVMNIGGKIQRVDFHTGAAVVIPFSAKVEAEIAPRIYFTHRVDDSDTVKARLIRWPRPSPDGKKLVFSSLNHIWLMDLSEKKPKRLTKAVEGEFMPTWSPDGRYIAYVTWSTNGGRIYRIAADGSGQPEALTPRASYYSEPVYSPDGSKIVYIAGRKDDQLYADLRYIEEEQSDLPDGREITGIRPPQDFDLRWIAADPAAASAAEKAGGDSHLIASTQGGAHPHFAQDPERVYLTSRRALTSVRLDGMDRRSVLEITGSSPGPLPPAAEEIKVAPDGQHAFVSLENKLYLVPLPKAGKETVKISTKARDAGVVEIKKMSPEGGEYLGWTGDGKAVTWSWGARFYRQAVATEKPEAFDVVVEAPRARALGTVVLSGAKVISMKGDEIFPRGDVVVQNNRILSVGPTGKVTVPAGAKVIDVRGKTIIPGLVDVHSHMWPPRGVHQTQVWQYLANLSYGVTTTRDPQTSTNDVFAYTDLVDTGEILGPRVLATGPGIFSSSGLDSQEAVRAFVKRYKEAYHTEWVKNYVPGDRNVRQWVAMACKEFGLTPTTEGALDMKLDLSQMADGFSGNEHALPIQPLYKDVVQFVTKTKTFYTPTTLVAYGAPWSENYYFETENVHENPKLRRFIPHELLDTMVKRRKQWFLPEEYGHKGIAKGVADIVHAGGRAGLGGHGQLQGLGDHWELWDLQSGGLTQLETLRVGTLFGAEALGLQQDLGSLEPGKLADLIVLDRDPLLDIRNTAAIRYVMKNGELYEGETLDRVWPQPQKLAVQYWQEPGASGAVSAGGGRGGSTH